MQRKHSGSAVSPHVPTSAQAAGEKGASNWDKLRQKLGHSGGGTTTPSVGKGKGASEGVPASSATNVSSAAAVTGGGLAATIGAVLHTKAGSSSSAAGEAGPAAASSRLHSGAVRVAAAGAAFGGAGTAVSAYSGLAEQVAATLGRPLTAVKPAGAPRERKPGSGPTDDPEVKRSILGPDEDARLSADEKRYIALDCEMVGVGLEGKRSILAEVVLVDWAGRMIYHKHVKPTEAVVDYRTEVSGITPESLKKGEDFKSVIAEVAALLRGKILVGHSLVNDLSALMLSHSWRDTRDTARYKPFCRTNRAGHMKPRRLKHLCEQHLGIVIQEGEHDPAEDARAALALYKKFRRVWEDAIKLGGASAGGAPPKKPKGGAPPAAAKEAPAAPLPAPVAGAKRAADADAAAPPAKRAKH